MGAEPVKVTEHLDLSLEANDGVKVTSIVSSSFNVKTASDSWSLVDISHPDSYVSPTRLTGFGPTVSPDSVLFASLFIDGVTISIREVKTMKVVKRCKLSNIEMWDWLLPNVIGIVTNKALFQLAVHDDSKPRKLCNIDFHIPSYRIMKCACDLDMKYWAVAGRPNDPQRGPAYIQVYSVKGNKSYMFRGMLPTFLTNQGRTLFCFFSPDDDEVHWNVSSSVLRIADVAALPHSSISVKFDIGFPPHPNVKAPMSLDVIVGSVSSNAYSIVFAISSFGSVAVFDVENGVRLYTYSLHNGLLTRFSKVVQYGLYKRGEEEGIICATLSGKILSVSVSKETLRRYVNNASIDIALRSQLAHRWGLVCAMYDTAAVPESSMNKVSEFGYLKRTKIVINGVKFEDVKNDKEEMSQKMKEISPVDSNSTVERHNGSDEVIPKLADVSNNEISESSEAKSKKKKKKKKKKRKVAESADCKEHIGKEEVVESSETIPLVSCFNGLSLEEHSVGDSLHSIVPHSIDNRKVELLQPAAEMKDTKDDDLDQGINECELSVSTSETNIDSPFTNGDVMYSQLGQAGPSSEFVNANAAISTTTTETTATTTTISPKTMNDPGNGRSEDKTDDAKPDDGGNGKLCIICYERPCNAVLAPCGHLWFCYECACEIEAKKEKCPACRAEVASIIKVYTLT